MQGTSGRLAKKHLHCLKSEQAMSLIRCDNGDYYCHDIEGLPRNVQR